MENGNENTNTFDHPYYVKGKGWCSYGQQLTKSRYNMDVGLLEVGDFCYYHDNGELREVEISYIREHLDDVQTYVIDVETLSRGIPLKRVSILFKVDMGTPTLPTSPSAIV